MSKSVETQKHPRFTNDELALIKDVFAENDELIRTCYKVFFQLPLEAKEQEMIRNVFTSKSLQVIFDKLFRPRLENEQLFLGIDDWFDLQFADKPLEEASLFIEARELTIAYVKQQVEALFGAGISEIKFADLLKGETPKDRFINLVARKEIINKVRSLFGILQVWAGTKKETKEEMMKRLFSNSNK